MSKRRRKYPYFKAVRVGNVIYRSPEDRDMALLQMFYSTLLSYRKLGRIFGISDMRVRQIVSRSCTPEYRALRNERRKKQKKPA